MAPFKSIWKKLRSFPELRNGPWPLEPAYRLHRLLWCCLLLLGSCCFLQAISIYWTARRFTGLLSGFCSAPLAVLLNLLPLLLLVGLGFALSGRVLPSVALPGFFLLSLSLVNALKINLRGDPLLFSDLSLAGEATGMLDRYSLVLSKSQWAGLAAFFLLLVLLYLLAGKIRLRGHWRLRGGVVGLCSLSLALLLLFVYPNDSLYKASYSDNGHVTARNATLWYSAHGFTYGFLHSILSQDTVDSWFSLSDTQDSGADSSSDWYLSADSSDGGDTANVNIIAIQLEAYCDVSWYLDTPAIEALYADLHALQADSISGRLLVNTNGGGTIDSERSFITGYTSLTDFDSLTNSYVWYLQSLGYTTEGSHPNTGSYYNRETVNLNLGFQSYFFSEGYYEYLLDLSNAYTRSDAVLFNEILSLMESCDGPYFSLNISLQNHGPYSSDTPTGTEYLSEEDCSNTTVRNIVNNYLNLIASTNQAIMDMTQELEAMDTPVLLVLFGDHMPYWGDYTALDYYAALGINADTATDEGYYNYYSTPYLIWANSAARRVLDTSCTGDGGDIGSCFLMNKVFALCGWTGDEMLQAGNRLLAAGITMVSSAVELYCENGQLVEELSPEGQAALEEFLAFQAVWQTSFVYGELVD